MGRGAGDDCEGTVDVHEGRAGYGGRPVVHEETHFDWRRRTSARNAPATETRVSGRRTSAGDAPLLGRRASTTGERGRGRARGRLRGGGGGVSACQGHTARLAGDGAVLGDHGRGRGTRTGRIGRTVAHVEHAVALQGAGEAVRFVREHAATL